MFHKLFSRSKSVDGENDIEKRLIAETTEALILFGGMTNREAEVTAKQMLDMTKDELRASGEKSIYQGGRGDKLLQMAESDTGLQEDLVQLYNTGVTREDFRHWHNLSPIEQTFFLTQDKMMITATYSALKAKGNSVENAKKLVSKTHPTFTAEPSQIDVNNPDSFLPAELKPRVNDYRNMRYSNDPEEFEVELDNSSSFNALIRDRLRDGKL